MEWLAIAIDAPLLVIALFIYLFFVIKHHKGFHAESMIFKLGNVGERFYEKFISLFHSKRGLFLGIAGMLVLHLLTDVGNFVIPYTFFSHDPLYFEQLGPANASQCNNLEVRVDQLKLDYQDPIRMWLSEEAESH